MNRFLQSLLISSIFTAVGSGYYMLFVFLQTAVEGTDLETNLINAFVGSLICWVFMTYVFYQLLGVFEEINKLGRSRRDSTDTKNDAQKGSDNSKTGSPKS